MTATVAAREPLPAALPSNIDPSSPPRQRSPRRRLRGERLMPTFLLLPAGIAMALFVVVPTLLSLVASFFQVPLAGGSWQFVGFANFERIATDPAVQRSIINTIVYSVLTIIPSLCIGLALALLAESVSRGRAFVRTALFLPMTANLVAMAVVFRWLFAYQGGFVNQALGFVGFAPLNWLGDADTALLTVALVGVWRGASFSMMIFIAGLATIPTTVQEASRAEGIRGFPRLFRITLPMMQPTVVFATVVAVLGSVQVFDTINVMTQGGPLNSTETILTQSYKLGFGYYDLGAASALSFLLLVVLIGVGIFQRRFLMGGSR